MLILQRETSETSFRQGCRERETSENCNPATLTCTSFDGMAKGRQRRIQRHQDHGLFRCFCGKLMYFHLRLREHIRVRHREYAVVVSPDCLLVSKTVNDFSNHRVESHEVIHYLCPFCGRNFGSERTYLEVGDFGLSKSKNATILTAKSGRGTPHWMASEVIGNEPSNEKSDVFSFGVSLWELVTEFILWAHINSLQGFDEYGIGTLDLFNPKYVVGT